MKPLRDLVLIRPDKAEETTNGGIIIAEKYREQPQQGVVLEIGPGRVSNDNCYLPISGIEPGMSVLFEKFAGTEVKIHDEECRLVQEEHVLAVIESVPA